MYIESIRGNSILHRKKKPDNKTTNNYPGKHGQWIHIFCNNNDKVSNRWHTQIVFTTKYPIHNNNIFGGNEKNYIFYINPLSNLY